MADSKAVRFAKMVDTLKDRLAAEGQNTQKALTETERLQKELDQTKELLASTERNYQGQLNMMTEYITNLQEAQVQQNQPR